MKIIHNLFLLTVTVLGLSIEDSNGNRSKEIVTITYSDGHEDRLVVDKKNINSEQTESLIMQLISKRTSK